MVWYGEYLRLSLVKDQSTFLQPSGQVLNCCSEALGDNFWLWTARTQRDVISKLNSGDVMRGKVKVSLSTGKLQDLQTLTLVTLGFAGFLRWDNLAHVRIDALSIHRDYMAVFLECRKNDQFRKGNWVFISRWEQDLCPVQLVEQFLASGDHSPNSALFFSFCLAHQGPAHPPSVYI